MSHLETRWYHSTSVIFFFILHAVITTYTRTIRSLHNIAVFRGVIFRRDKPPGRVAFVIVCGNVYTAILTSRHHDHDIAIIAIIARMKHLRPTNHEPSPHSPVRYLPSTMPTAPPSSNLQHKCDCRRLQPLCSLEEMVRW